MSLTSKNLLRAITGLLFVIVILTPLFYLKQSLYPYISTKTLFFQALIEILVALWLAFIIRHPQYRPKRTPFLVALLMFLGVLTLTGFFGVDPLRSFWSTQERMLGIFAFWHFGALIVVLSSLYPILPKKKLLFASLVTASIVSAIAFLQLKSPNLLLNEGGGQRPGATFGNPTFFAGYLLFNIFAGLYLLFDTLRLDHAESEVGSRRSYDRYGEIAALCGAVLLDIAALFMTQTRGDIIGFGVGLLALLTLFVVRPPSVRLNFLRQPLIYRCLAGAMLAFGAVFFLTRENAVWSGIPGINRFRDISINDPSLQPRLHALKVAWLAFTEKPLLGWGWENFNVPFNAHYDPKLLELNYQETRFDKPHNVVLEYLVAGGFPLALAYLALLVALGIELWRGSKDKLFVSFIAAAFLSYLVRSIFIFETLGPLLMFSFLAAFVDGAYLSGKRTSEERKQVSEAPRETPRHPYLPHLLLLFALAPVYGIQAQSIAVTRGQYWGFVNFVNRKPDAAIQSFEDALAVWSPYHWNVQRDFAAAIAENHFYRPETIPVIEVIHAIQEMESAVREHSADAYNHYALLDMYNEVSDVNPGEYLAGAEREAKVALDLSPNRQQVYFSLAKTKLLEGNKDEAMKLVKYGLDLSPNVADAHFYYGLMLSDAGSIAEGYRELKTAIALGKKWKNYHEPFIVANFIADAGHVDEAVPIYEQAFALEPSDPEVEVKLGVAYLIIGKRDLAREHVGNVARRFDLTKSPAYPQLLPILRELGLAQ